MLHDTVSTCISSEYLFAIVKFNDRVYICSEYLNDNVIDCNVYINYI